MIKLAGDTISDLDITAVTKWMTGMPQFTKGELTIQFEQEFSKWIGSKYSIFVNSGSSANMLMIYSLIEDKMLKNKKIVVPTLSWATTVAPIIQFGLEPIICDVDMETLGCNLELLEHIFKKEKPSALLIVDVLGFPNKKEVYELCNKYKVMAINDNCETMGSKYDENTKAGTLGMMSSFSCYYSHIISTIEGGIITTDDKKLYDTLKMLRSHGWTRDLDEETQLKYKNDYKISDFKNLYTFYKCGFNVRPTDLQAKLALQQMKKIDMFCGTRNHNFNTYQSLIKNEYWKIKPIGSFIVNMAYPVIHPKRDEIVEKLIKNKVETRPLVCGTMSRQPFIKERKIKCYDERNSKIIDDYGLYVPNHPYLQNKEIRLICDIINEVINNG